MSLERREHSNVGNDSNGLVCAATCEEVRAAGGLFGADIEGRSILIVHIDGRYFALDGVCTHSMAWLEYGDMYPDTMEIQCPLHTGRFDVRTGEATKRPCVKPLAVYPVKVEEGKVWISMGGEETGDCT